MAIARALLRQPRIYLLDEPPSRLDSKTKAEIMKALSTLTAGYTTLVIAHRLSTVMGGSGQASFLSSMSSSH